MHRAAAVSALLLLVALAGLQASCKSDDRRHSPALSAADEKARDRAHRMEDQGRACDASDPQHRNLIACRQACSLGHSNSCGWLGDAYARGLGVAIDAKRALERYRQACTGGSGLGCEGVAEKTREAKYYTEARMVYRVHCSQKHAASCSRLARLFAEGLGGPPAPEVAITYRQRACALGRKSECAMLR